MADNPITDENNVVLYDDAGNKIGVVLKNSIYRLEGRNILTSPDGTKDVSVTTDGAKQRLDVNAKIDTTVPNPSNISALVTAGYVYSCAFSVNMASAGTANPLFLLKNPSGSGKTVYIHSLRFGVNVENNYGNFVIFANPTITANGTAETARNRCVGGGFGASAMTTFKLPTVSANGNQLENLEVAQNGNSIEAATHFAIHVAPNNNLLITGDPKSNNREAVITVVWAEF